MTSISQATLVEAATAVGRMGTGECAQLADEVFLRQPNLLASVLALHQMGASHDQLGVLVNLLLVAYQAMKTSGHSWPVISQQTQDRCLRRLTGKMRFAEGLAPELVQRAVEQQVDEHGERYLLAYVYGQLRDHDLLGVKTEVEKYMMLAALNLVECIAVAAAPGAGTTTRTAASRSKR